MTIDQWKKEQSNYPDIRKIVQIIQNRQLHKYKIAPGDLCQLGNMLWIIKQFVMQNGLLYRKIKNTNRDTAAMQFVLLELFSKQVFIACHKDVGHFAQE